MIRSLRPVRAALVVLVVAGAAVVPANAAFADSIRDRQWYLTDLDIAQAHQVTKGAGVTIALIDSGVEADHRDLRGAVLPGTDVNSGRGGDGRFDTDGHGTEMAGIIAGRGHGSGDGVLGIAPAAKILPISAPTDTLTTSNYMTAAVDFAIAHHATVINMSFGTGDDAALHAAIGKARAADIVLVAASGNGTKDGLDYPGLYPEVLTVGAYGRDGQVASFSTTGSQVDLVAPGVDIVTTGDQSADDYYDGQGTSEATAVVSGAAALLRARYPQLSAPEIVHRLTATAVDAGPKGRDDSYGYGRLDIVKALTADVPTLGSSAAPTKAATAAPGGTSAAGPGDLPTAKSPVLLVGVGVVVLLGLVLIVVLVTRGRRRAR